MTAKQQLGMIKKVFYWATTNAKLLAYKTICLPLEYAAAAWGPSSQKYISGIEHKTTSRSRSTIYSWYQREEGVENAKSRLELFLLHIERRG